VIKVELADEWEPELVHAYGALLIAASQLEWQLFIVAKRKDGRGLLRWLQDNPDQRFSNDACWIERKFPQERQLVRAVGRAKELWERRNAYVHAVWCRYRGKPVRRRNFINRRLSEKTIKRLTEEIRGARDRLDELVP
jgi:hypothetical protein